MTGSLVHTDFYRALRRVECEHRELPRIGRAELPADEALRLAQAPALGFEATSIVEHERERVAVSFFGVFGPNGPLPLHLTELAYQRAHQDRDPGLARFADVFHHRLLSFLYRAWAEAQPTVSADRPDDDRFARRLGALAGLPAADGDMLCAAGHLASHTRHPEGLAKLLTLVFGAPAQIEEHIGEWLTIPEEYCWRFGRGSMGVIGESSRVGTQVWDCQSKFRVVLGPLKRDDHARFLPGSPELQRLIELVQHYAGPQLGWGLRLVLDEPERRPALLGEHGKIGRDAHLGGDPEGAWQDLELDPLSAV
jgi:type VI secretion system protein ImpH